MRHAASFATRSLLVAAMALFGGACTNRDPHGPVSATARTDAPGSVDTLRLAAGQRGSVDDGRLTIDFLRVAADSRCPSTANCVWAGDAAAELRLTASREARTVTVHTTTEPRRASHGGYDVALVHVEPYPDGHRPIAPAEYVAVLEVTRR
jgi:hypothetical protein